MKSKRKTYKDKTAGSSRQAILDYLTTCDGHVTLLKLADALAVEGKVAQRALRKRVKALQGDGELVYTHRDGYSVAKSGELFEGVVIGNAGGYGFLRIENEADDLYLPAREMRSLLDGDRVSARLGRTDRRGRRAATVVKVLEHKNQSVVGRYFEESGVAFVVSRNKRIHQNVVIPKSMSNGAKSGQYVVAKITQQPAQHSGPIGNVVDLLPQDSAVGKADVVIRTHNIPDVWPAEVLQEISGLASVIDKDEIKRRKDIRNLPLITIDGEDAQDFDDAVYCESEGDGWRLLVAIADVSHYVHVGTALDKEAIHRGNSVYFPRHVVPMLPEVLSNGMCSLKPKADRLCIVCELHIDSQGKVTNSGFFEGVMNSAARVTYTEFVTALAGDDQELLQHYKDVLPQFKVLHTLSMLLNQHRRKKGALDFASTEIGFEFDDAHCVTDIHGRARNDAHRLIEELMLVANVAAAELLSSNDISALYRVHSLPKKSKLDALHKFLAGLGLQFDGEKQPTILSYADLMTRTAERDDAHLIEMMLLCSMQLANYSETNNGHFGLAFPVYTHFTSPIRRYADVIVHRSIRHFIQYKKQHYRAHPDDYMRELAEHISTTERRAEEASRDIIQWYKCEFMRDKVGNCYQGIISNVTTFGLFVQLDDLYVDGLIHVTNLPTDNYRFDAAAHYLLGERGGKKFRFGDRIKVKVSRVDVESQKIDLEWIE